MLRTTTLRGLPGAALVTLSVLLPSCSAYRYDPVEEQGIAAVAQRGCKKGERVTTVGEVNQVHEDTFVVWDGRDPETTLTLKFREPGVGRKTKGVFGKNRYERAYEALQDIKEDEEPVEVTFVCKGERRTPIATRFSYRDAGGDEVAYEF